jgi:hypothetical protein
MLMPEPFPIIRRGKRRPGFETPARLLGVEFAKSIAGTTITDHEITKR